MVQTVLGAKNASELGVTLMHEHIAMIDPAMTLAFPDWIDTEKLDAVVLPQLDELSRLGVKTIIDATPINLGRDVRVIKHISEKSGITMIASTGLYHFENPWVSNPNSEWIAKMYTREIKEGIQGTDIKAGVIKCATDAQGVTDWNRKMLEAAAIASAENDIPIISHTDVTNRSGIEQLRVLLNAGANPKRIAIGHCGDSNDLEYLEEILSSGCYIGLDRFGLEQFNSMENRINTLFKLIQSGYTPQLLLSHDSNFYSDPWRAWHVNRYIPQTPGHNMRLLHTTVLPRLAEMGISESQIEQMMVNNVRRLFE